MNAAILGAVYFGAFGVSHPLAKKIGPWPSVLTVAAVSAAAAWALSDRRSTPFTRRASGRAAGSSASSAAAG